MKALVNFLFCAVIVCSLASCLKDDGYVVEDVGVGTFVNGLAESQYLSYTLDGNTFLRNQYQEVNAQYLKIGTRNYMISDDQKVIVDTTIKVQSDSVYSSIVFGTKETPKMIMTSDQPIPDLATNSGVRFLNISNFGAPVSMRLDNTPLDAFANRRTENSATVSKNQVFQSLKPLSNKTITIHDAEGGIVATRENVYFESGRYYTILFMNNSPLSSNLYSIFIY